MFTIVEANSSVANVKQFTIEAPRIARAQSAGQFVILRLHEHGERIPLTIADSDPEAGTITIVVQAIGKTTMLLNMLEAGDAILDIVGPLGKPSDDRALRHRGRRSAAASARRSPIRPHGSCKRAGNNVISIVGARSKDLLILEDEVRAVSDETLHHAPTTAATATRAWSPTSSRS